MPRSCRRSSSAGGAHLDTIEFRGWLEERLGTYRAEEAVAASGVASPTSIRDEATIFRGHVSAVRAALQHGGLPVRVSQHIKMTAIDGGVEWVELASRLENDLMVLEVLAERTCKAALLPPKTRLGARPLYGRDELLRQIFEFIQADMPMKYEAAWLLTAQIAKACGIEAPTDMKKAIKGEKKRSVLRE